MPELPEMENYRILLSGKLLARRITGTHIERVKSINVPPEQFDKEVVGQSITHIGRRAKHLLFYLSNGRVLLLHLMLGGILYFGNEEDRPERTVQVTLEWDRDRLYFIGLRLGYLHLHSVREAEELLGKLGPDPFDPDFTLERFSRLLDRKSGTLKGLLTDQAAIAGIGNCYSDEICFQAGLLPERRPSGLSADERSRLYAAMRAVLTEATQAGGYMEMPLFRSDALTGGFDQRCRVYDREGEPCVRCGGLLERRTVSSKKSFCCPLCQH